MNMRAKLKAGLTQRGLAPHIADAFIMNFQDESGLNPGINEANPTVAGSRGGYGLYQLTGPRRRQYEAFASQKGVPLDSVDAQLDFMMQELQGSESNAAKDIFAAKDTGTAAAAIVNKFLRPAEAHRASRVARYTGGGSNDTLLGGLSLTPDRVGAPSILDTMEAPEMEPQKATGILGSLFGDMTEDRADQIRLGVNGMLHNPNRGLERQVQGRMDDRRTDKREQKASQQAAQQANKTAAWLATQPGGEQFAQAIASGALPAGQALDMWRSQSKGPEPTALVQQYQLAQQQGYSGSFMDYQTDLKKAGAATSSVTVNNSDGNPMLGTIPQGYEAVRDPETGAFTMRPVPGGPEDNSEKDALADEGKRRSGDVVIEDIDRVITKMDDGGLPVAGMGGGILSNIPGTDAHDVSKLINTIKANVGFDRLQQMRDSSPTGGALGAINQSEMTLLNSALGSLEQSQSPEQFKENLTRLKGIYQGIVHGAGGSEAPATAGAESAAAPDFSSMSDAELDAYIESGGR